MSMTSASQEIEFLACKLDETMIGLDLLDTQEITSVSDITAVPRTPDYVEGIINLRGNVVTVINTGKKLGLKSVEMKPDNRVIILSYEEEYIGLMIDDIDTVIRTDSSQIGPAPGNLNGAQKNFFKGTLTTREYLVGVLETDMIFKR